MGKVIIMFPSLISMNVTNDLCGHSWAADGQRLEKTGGEMEIK